MRAPLWFLSMIGLLGCVGRLGPTAPAPKTRGEHPVGVTSIDVRDPRRHRTMRVEVWYPAGDPSPKGEPAVYEVKALGSTVARLRSPTGARRHAEPWRGGGPRPVVVVSHGAGSSRFAHTSLSEVLASHGYVVAAPDHVGHTTADKVWGISEDERAQSAFDRPLDLSRVIDALARRSARGDRTLGGLVDIDRIAVAGHSFGGRAALGLVGAQFDVSRQRRECRIDDDDRDCHGLEAYDHSDVYRYRDPRVKAALLIAPAGFEFYRTDGIAQVDAPVLVVGTRRDRTTPFTARQAPLFDSLKPPHYMLELDAAGHLTPTDVCAIVNSIGFLGKAFGGADARDGCGDDYMPSRRALDLVAIASLAFFQVHLNDEPSAADQLRAALRPSDDRRMSRTAMKRAD